MDEKDFRATRDEVIFDIVTERQRQVDKGFDHDHDCGHEKEELLLCARNILKLDEGRDIGSWWLKRARKIREKYERRDQLKIAAALIVAEMERIDNWEKEWAE